jgi:hypothetical protein
LLSIEKRSQQEISHARKVSGFCSKFLSFSDFSVGRMQELSACTSCIAYANCRWVSSAGGTSSSQCACCNT